MQANSLDIIIKVTLVTCVGTLLFGSLEILNQLLTSFYDGIQCEYHYTFLNVTHKTQHLGALKFYMLSFVGLLIYILFFRIPDRNHVIFYMNVMAFLLLGCLLHDIAFKSPLNSFAKFVSHFMNGAFFLTAFNFLMIIFISTFTVKRMMHFMLYALSAFIINLVAFLIYFLLYEFIFGATSVYIFIFVFIFCIFQFNIMLMCHYLRGALATNADLHP